MCAAGLENGRGMLALAAVAGTALAGDSAAGGAAGAAAVLKDFSAVAAAGRSGSIADGAGVARVAIAGGSADSAEITSVNTGMPWSERELFMFFGDKVSQRVAALLVKPVTFPAGGALGIVR